MTWLKKAMESAVKPKESVISILRKNLSGVRKGRELSQLHASDITSPEFCPREWAFRDLHEIKSVPQWLSTATAATFSLGSMIAKLLIEEWAGNSVIGNWKCARCQDFRSMTVKPMWSGCTAGTHTKHLWEYEEVVFEFPEYAFSGSIDAIFNLGAPYWRIVELKIIAPDAFEKLLAPLPEHRIRTSLYLQLIANSKNVWRSSFNLSAATVLYVSRGYGKKNLEWDEVLPFKEFEVKRDDSSTEEALKRAKELKFFREETVMPSGICNTALDRFAKSCSFCKECFSGDYPANLKTTELKIIS